MIAAHDLGVRFLFDRQRRVMTSTLARIRRSGVETWGLRNVSFEIAPGAAVALLGRSGSGKTTLLRLLAGVYKPDEGSLEVRGRVASLLSTEAGLLSFLTGRENAFHLGVLAGLSRRDARAALDDVKTRSGLDDYFERPVVSYSQGMRARLGFAAGDTIGPQTLLLDEVHEALDHEYRDVIEQRAHQVVGSGGVVVAAGHDHPMLARLCSRAIYLDNGTVADDGPFGELRREYLDDVRTGSHR